MFISLIIAIFLNIWLGYALWYHKQVLNAWEAKGELLESTLNDLNTQIDDLDTHLAISVDGLNSLIKQDDFHFINPHANGGFVCVLNGTHYQTTEDALTALNTKKEN